MKLSNIYNNYLKYIIWFIIFISISLLLTLNNYEKTKRSYDENKFSELKTKIAQVFKEFERNSDFIFNVLKTDANLRKILLQINTKDTSNASKLRKDLFDSVQNLNLNFEELGIFKLYFIRSDKTVFLRYFNPESFDDSFENQTLLGKVIQTNSAQSGFTPGLYDFSYRRIYPLELDGKKIGFVEMVLSEQYFAEALSYDKTRFTLLNYYFNDLKMNIPKNLHQSPFLKDYFIKLDTNYHHQNSAINPLYHLFLDKLSKQSDLQYISSQKTEFHFHFESLTEMYSVYFIPIYTESKIFCGYLMHGFKNITLENKLFDVIILNVGVGIFLVIILSIIAYRKKNIEKFCFFHVFRNLQPFFLSFV